MQGQMRAIITPEGEKVVTVQWPSGDGFVLGRDEALRFAFTMLATVRNLFASVDELNAVVAMQGYLSPVPQEPLAQKPVQ